MRGGTCTNDCPGPYVWGWGVWEFRTFHPFAPCQVAAALSSREEDMDDGVVGAVQEAEDWPTPPKKKGPPPPGLATPTDFGDEVPPPPPGTPPSNYTGAQLPGNRDAGDLQYSSGADGSSKTEFQAEMIQAPGTSDDEVPPPPPGTPPPGTPPRRRGRANVLSEFLRTNALHEFHPFFRRG